MLEEGTIYTIKNQNSMREGYKRFKYFRLKYWDGHNWIIRFIKSNATDWIALPESRIFSLINNRDIEKASPHETLDAILMERKNEGEGWKRI